MVGRGRVKCRDRLELDLLEVAEIRFIAYTESSVPYQADSLIP